MPSESPEHWQAGYKNEEGTPVFPVLQKPLYEDVQSVSAVAGQHLLMAGVSVLIEQSRPQYPTSHRHE
jgi:hypothetical protein